MATVKDIAEYFDTKIPYSMKMDFDNVGFLVGDGSVLCYNSLLKEVTGLVLPPEHRQHQRACGVALVAARHIAAGEAGSGAALTPNYLRLSQAEREKLEKQKK